MAVEQGSAAQNTKQFREAISRLRAAEQLIAELPPDRRDLARWFVGIREAELLLFAGRSEKAVEKGLAVRDWATDKPDIYKGHYRVRLLIILWLGMPGTEFYQELDEGAEVDWLLDGHRESEDLVKAPSLLGKYRILRAELLLRRGEDQLAMSLLRQIAEELSARMAEIDRQAGLTPEDPSVERLKEKQRLESDRAACLQMLANEYHVSHDLTRARIYLEQLPAEQGRYQLAQIALKMGDPETAERLARDLEAMDSSNRYRPEDAVIGQLLGDSLEAQEKLKAARGAYEKVLVAAHSPEARAAARNGLGDCWRREGELDKARAEYRAAAAHLEGRSSHIARATSIENAKDQGLVEELAGDFGRAFKHFERSLTMAEEARQGIARDLMGVAWLEPDFLPGVDGALRTRRADGEDLWRILALMDQCKARGMLDWIHDPPRGGDRKALRQAIGALVLAEDRDDFLKQQRELEAERSKSTGRQRRFAVPLDATRLRELVGSEPGTLFLSYWAGRQRVRLIVARGGGEEITAHDLGSKVSALALLGGAYESVADPVPDPWPAIDRAAHFFLPEALHEELQNADRLVFCPGPDLGRLPFEALRIGGQPLGTFRPIEWAPSLSVRHELKAREAVGDAVVVMDSVITSADKRARLGVDPLAFSKDEGDSIAELYGDRVRRIRGDEASFSGLTELLESAPPELLHISAHAVASSRIPSASLLLLAGDEFVDMASMASLPLRGSLVVLSSCSSATGEERSGEGVVGVLWGPLAAGSRAVVASLWRVNQQATADLMTQFHWFRSQGHRAASAMTEARKVLAAAANYSHPHYWAGFAINGAAPRQLASPGEGWVRDLPSWALLLAPMALVIALAGFVRLLIWWVRRRSPKTAI